MRLVCISDTYGVESLEMDDGVISFLMDKFENRNIEKDIRSIAKKFKVKFEKGDFTDGLGMIYTKNASRRMR